MFTVQGWALCAFCTGLSKLSVHIVLHNYTYLLIEPINVVLHFSSQTKSNLVCLADTCTSPHAEKNNIAN